MVGISCTYLKFGKQFEAAESDNMVLRLKMPGSALFADEYLKTEGYETETDLSSHETHKFEQSYVSSHDNEKRITLTSSTEKEPFGIQLIHVWEFHGLVSECCLHMSNIAELYFDEDFDILDWMPKCSLE